MPVTKPISTPADLDIPKKMDEVMQGLGDDGRARFIVEIVEALTEAKKNDDLVPVQYVVDAWYVSQRFLTHPDIEKALDTALDVDGSNLYHSAHELGERLGVA